MSASCYVDDLDKVEIILFRFEGRKAEIYVQEVFFFIFLLMADPSSV